ncbi:MAG: hypothetical protein SF070_11005 [Gemmatimonadota bacterium]|nr:hypothetical protein [Gemmatimonadota bacterium]
MDADTRRRIEMGQRILHFSRQHPADDPGHQAVVNRLADRLEQARRSQARELSGHKHEAAAIAHRDEVRASIQLDLVVLASLCRMAHRDGLDGVDLIRLPQPKDNLVAFHTVARTIEGQGKEHREKLRDYGPIDVLLDRLAASLEQFESLEALKSGSFLAHVGAYGGLRGLGMEIVQLARHLDCLNRHRFQGRTELLAAWKSARNVAWRGRRDDGTTDEATVA